MRTSNKKCRALVQSLTPFQANNLFAVREKGLYIVFSYGRHWPLFIHADGTWYENSDRYSVSTSRHRSQANPYTLMFGKTRGELLGMIDNAWSVVAA